MSSNNKATYRSKVEIIHDILQAISTRDRCRKKDIMFYCNLSYHHSMQYIALLQKNGLIKYIPANEQTGEKDYYIMIDGGKQFLTMFKVIHKLIKSEKKESQSKLVPEIMNQIS